MGSCEVGGLLRTNDGFDIKLMNCSPLIVQAPVWHKIVLVLRMWWHCAIMVIMVKEAY